MFQPNLIALSVAVAASCAAQLAYANPAGPVVVNGQATFATGGNLLSVTNTPGAIINWQQFGINASETTRFIQQSAASAVLNRVVGADPSRILGTLQSNGRVFLVNPNGIVFGAGAQIDVGGLVASTLNLSNQDFIAGRINFTGDPARSAAVVNQGRITASQGGRVYLVGSAVENQGVITAPNGDIVLAAGKSVRVTEGATPGVQVEITAPVDRALNLSELAYGPRGAYAGLVSNSGVINADSAVRGANGSIVFKASNGVTLEPGSRVSAAGPDGGRIMIDAQQGVASVSGSVDATGKAGRGGSILIAGEHTGLFDGVRVDASGATGGGTILVGGDFQGRRIEDGGLTIANSQRTYVSPTAALRADAIDAGDGGKVIVWADETTRYYGNISVRGGAQGGNGGSIEVSGKQNLTFDGKVDTSAARGRTGTLLLDPNDLFISTGVVGGATEDTTNPFQATDGSDHYVTAATLQALAPATAVSLQANHDIVFQTGLAMPTTGAGSISMTASNQIQVAGFGLTTAGGSVSMSVGSGGITNLGNVNLAGGVLTINSSGSSSQGAGVISGTTSLVKQGSGTLTLSAANTYAGTTTVNGGTLSLQGGNAIANAGAVTVGAAGTLDLQNNETIGSLAGAVGAQVSLNSNTLTTGDATSTTFAGVISGAGGALTKQGTGAFTLIGANTYTGATAVNAGVLNLQNATATGATSGGVTVANGAALELQGGITVGNEALSITGTGVGGNGALRNISDNNAWGGTVTLAGAATIGSDAGTLTLSAANAVTGAAQNLTFAGAGNVAIGGTITNTTGTVTKTGAGTLTLGASDRLADASSLVVNGGTFDIAGFSDTVAGVQLLAGTITGTIGVVTSTTAYDLQAGTVNAILAGTVGVTKSGTGTVTLKRANTYTGATAINAGTLAVTVNDALGTIAAGTTVEGPGTLDFQGVAYTTLEPLTLHGGTIATSTGTSSFANAVTMTASSSVSADAGAQLTLPGVISGTGFGLTKTGAGTVVLSAVETYTGNTTVNAGTLALGASDRLVDSTSLVVNGGTFDLQSFNETMAGVQLLSGTITGTSGILTSTTPYDLQAGTVSAILTGSVGVNKTGTGTVTLTRANTYTGATAVNNGTLAVTVNNALSGIAAGTTVESGGTLDLQNVAYTTLEPLTLHGGTIAASTGNSSFSNAVTMTASSSVSAGSGATLTLPGVISGAGFGLSKNGAGTVVLSAAETYTGNTTVNDGTLALGASDRLVDTTSLVVNGGTFDLQSFSETVTGVQLLSGTITGTSGILTSKTNYDVRSGTVSAVVTGFTAGVGVDKTTTGTVTLTRANTYAGATAVSAGTLAVTSNDALGTTASGTTVAGAGTLDFQNVTYSTLEGLTINGGTIATSTGTSSFANAITLGANSTASVGTLADPNAQLTLLGVISGAGLGLTKIGPGKLVLSGNNIYTGVTHVNEGTLALGASNRLDDVSTLVVDGGTFDILNFNEIVTGVQLLSGTITGGSGILTSKTNFDLQGGTVSAILTGFTLPVGVDKSGPGTVTLTRANLYSGATTITQGTLAVTSNDALGTTAAGTTVEGAGTLDFQNVAYTTAENLTLHGGTVATSTGTSSFAGAVSLTANSTASVTGTQLTLSGVISESGGTFGLTKIGTGTLVVAGDNTYTGVLKIDEGTVALGASDRLNDASSLVVSGGTFDIRTFNETVHGVQLQSGTITGDPGAITGVLTSATNYDLWSGSVSAKIAGTVGVDKTTAGTVTLSRDNLYTGATAVSAGTLVVTAGNALGTTGAGTTVTSGATLSIVNAAIVAEPVTLNGSGVLGVGALTGTGTASLAGDVTLNTASTIGVTNLTDTLTLSGVVEGTGALSLIGAGTVTLANTVGGTTALASFTQSAATRLHLDGGLVRTTGNQTYNGAVTTGGATTLRTTANGSVSAPGVSGVFNATAGPLTLDTGAGNATFTNILNDFGTVLVTSGGAVSLVDANSITLGNANLSVLTARARSGNVTLGGNVAATGSGDSIVLVASGNFINNAGAAALDSGPGRFLVYSTSPLLGSRGGLPYDFKQYNATFGVTTVLGTGDGFLYTVAPSVTAGLTGTVTKVYDATTAATVIAGNYSFAGAIDGDTISLNNASSGTYDNRHVGSGKLVSVSGFSLAGASNGTATVYGYQLLNTAASGNVGAITPASVTVTATDQSKTYGQTFNFAGTEFTSSALQGGETITSVALASAGAPATAHVAGSPYEITVSGASGTFTPGDYTISYVNGVNGGHLTVNPALLTLTANDQTKAYGGSPFVFTGGEFTSSGLQTQNGDAIASVTLTSAGTASTANVTVLPGNPPYPITITPITTSTPNFVPGDYAITYVDGKFTVNPPGLPVIVTANNQSKTYGTTFTFTGSEFTAIGLQNNETIGSVVLASPGAPATARVASSPYVISVNSASGGTFDPGNYTITYVGGQLTVVPAALTVTADNKSRIQGQPNPPFTATYKGFQLGETPGVLTGVLGFNTPATASSVTGTYPIVPFGQTSTDYAIAYVDGALRISPPDVNNPIFAELRRLGIEHLYADFTDCPGQGSVSSLAAAPKRVASRPPLGCASSSSVLTELTKRPR